MDPVLVTVYGETNPALVALQWIQSMYIDEEIDVSSFESVAESIGEFPDEPGFFIRTTEDLNRLCTMGDFVIFYSGDDGLFKCMDAHEFKQSKYYNPKYHGE